MTGKTKRAQKLILVVDDSATVRYAVCGILERLEFRVAEAEDGDGALKAMADEKPDLVILDIHMPVKGGIETLKEMRAHPGYADLPVFILTSSAGASYVKQAVAHGISGYLVKVELNPTDLADRIGTVLGKVAARPKKLKKISRAQSSPRSRQLWRSARHHWHSGRLGLHRYAHGQRQRNVRVNGG